MARLCMSVLFAALFVFSSFAVDMRHGSSLRSHAPANFDPEGCQRKLQEVCGEAKSPDEMASCATENEAKLVESGCLSKAVVADGRDKARSVCPPGDRPDPKTIFDCLQKNRALLEGNGCPVPPAPPVEAASDKAQQT